MKLLHSLVVLLTLGVVSADAEDLSSHVSEDTLKQLSVRGEKLVEEEMRKALFGVKQMREVMWRNQLKHQHLMESLRRSGDKKKGAAQLAMEVTEKLKEAEEQCKDSLQSEWEQCRPCLEDACKTFYTSTCRRGFGTFQAKVETFFQKLSSRFGTNEPPTDGGDIPVTRSTDTTDTELVHIEESFHRWMDQVSLVVNRSVALVSMMSGRLDDVLQKAFLNYSDVLTAPEESTSDPYYPARDSGFLQGVGLDEVLSSFFDFGKSVVEEFGAVVTQVFDVTQEATREAKNRGKQSVPRFLQNQRLCRDLRKQTSECWQLQDQCQLCQGALLSECPGVRELHMELDEVSQLVLVSREQYDEILSIVKRHADETVSWLRDMAAEFSWVAPAENAAPENIFQITKMAPANHDEQNLSSTETKVEVNILNSTPILLSVPGDLQMQDLAFVQYVAQEALDKYKGMVR
ncbi:clusterin-like protein 1 [Cynoglossus semilaevis]|uniref:clusterin-like protein 1 n=1 Tax=Cynoglossus semilaevis TaxID=244447 RepID=UPI0004982FDE|nr:clusterin-like protein 1 [Cynoglossus semilaevis]